MRVTEVMQRPQTEKVVKKNYAKLMMLNNPYDEVNIMRRQQRMYVQNEEYGIEPNELT